MNSEHASNTSERQQQEQQYNSFLYKFQQQIIDAWKPVPYTKNNVILYSILTTICIGLGLALILTSSQYQEIQKPYGGEGSPTLGLVNLSFTLTQSLPPPIYLYYGLSNYYQNHRRYLKFFSPQQMGGTQIDLATATSQCGSDADTNDKVGGPGIQSITGATLNGNGPAFPCGQRAKSFLQIKDQLDNMKLLIGTGPTAVAFTRDGVSWPDDKTAYKNSGNLSNQLISNEDEAWLVWFRPAAQNYFFKLHSIISQQLNASTLYTFQTKDVFPLSYGTKYFHLSKANYMGNKDYLLGIAFLVLGGGCLIVLIVFIAKCVTQMRGKSKQN